MKNLPLVFFLFLAQSSFSQKLTYDIFLFGNVIGQSVVERKIINDTTTHFSLTSNSEAHIFFTVKKNYLEYDITYTNNKLLSSSSKNIRNDESFFTTVTREPNGYLVKRNEEAVIIKPGLDCSSVKLFYAEPCNNREIFSERLGEFRPIKKNKDLEYEVDMKDGITYYYRYKNGKLIELEMKKGLLGSVYLRPHR